MADGGIHFVTLLLRFFSSPMASFEINVDLLYVRADYVRRRLLNVIRLLSLPISKASLKRLDGGRRQTRPQRFWVRPGRISAWWVNFTAQVGFSFRALFGLPTMPLLIYI